MRDGAAFITRPLPSCHFTKMKPRKKNLVRADQFKASCVTDGENSCLFIEIMYNISNLKNRIFLYSENVRKLSLRENNLDQVQILLRILGPSFFFTEHLRILQE